MVNAVDRGTAVQVLVLVPLKLFYSSFL